MIRGKIVEPIYKKEMREIPYCPTCGLKLEGSEKEYWGDTAYRCNCGFWTCVFNKKLKQTVFKLTKGFY
jgi:tRNA(Ile2) C34 agmatinyltransferase TiaS